MKAWLVWDMGDRDVGKFTSPADPAKKKRRKMVEASRRKNRS